MSTYQFIIDELSRNQQVFKELLRDVPKEVYLWKNRPNRWCLLEIVCHLYDEEREDFRARTKHILETPDNEFIPIDPEGWVAQREYITKEYSNMLSKFLHERSISINWLKTLQDPKWNNVTIHPEFGEMTAQQFMANWLAHDYLHIRQITNLKLDYLKKRSQENFQYAEGD
ncbi:DinB family protein [Aquimarina litoralis]|uniref:DinB family protein n=1 Tax=Aquimarina litoralis TaxID=584605 RepID=UPI001C5901E1|nr:DinB family protein [Aquimarina litoralis]MBW1294605.1 DinB family protein [Aquimarina litoralis]